MTKKKHGREEHQTQKKEKSRVQRGEKEEKR
jgi:hypothetical protein